MQRIEKGLMLLAFLALLGVSVSEVHSFDVFWQLQSGKYMLQTKSFIYQDIFTLASDAPRYEHCWLHDIALYLAYLLGGYGGISVLKGLLVTGTALALVAAARVRNSSWLAILFFFPAIYFSRGGWLERPQLWSFFFFAVFVWLLERNRVADDKKLFLLVPAMAMWVNLHAGSVLAAAIMLAYLVGEGVSLLFRWSKVTPSSYKKLWWLVLLLFLASLLTPYPSELLKTLLHAPKLGVSVDASGKATGSIMALFNMDWRPTTFARDPFFFYGLGVAAVVMLLGWRRLSLTDLCLLAGLGLMGLKLSRHTPFFFLGAMAILPAYAQEAVRPLLVRIGDRPKQFLRIGGQVAAVALIVYFTLPAYRVYGFFNTGLRTWHYPIEATEFVQENRLAPNLYNTYDWGGYLAWKLYPDYRVFWDGRQNSGEMFRLGLQVMMGHEGWEEILEKFRVNTIVSKTCTVDTGRKYPILDRLRNHDGWALVFADESSLVFVRRASVDAAWLKANRLPETRIDDTVLSEATLLTRVNPGRFDAWREMALIYLKRRQNGKAFWAIRNYLARAPQPDPAMQNYYRILSSQMRGRRG